MTGDDRTRTSPQVAAVAAGPTRLCHVGIALIAERRPQQSPEGPWGFFMEQKRVIGRSSESGVLCLNDPEMSRRHFSLELHDGCCWLQDLESHNRTFVNGAMVGTDPVPLRPGSIIRAGGSILVYEEVPLRQGLRALTPQRGVGLARVHAEALVDTIAPTDKPLLVIGPTGAGKERLVQRAHDASGRSGRLVAVNCANFSRELLGSELFGHVAGAFSGAARDREGLVRAAHQGTLFLDEVADLPLDQQASLLRMLQEGRVRPVGSDTEIAVDVRVIAATHKDLNQMAQAETFRADLLARLAGLKIELPGLSDRRIEILELFAEFFGNPELIIGRDVAESLLLHDWPLNVRELKHVAENAAVFAPGATALDPALLPDLLPDRPVEETAPTPPPSGEPWPKTIPGAPSREELEALLKTHGGAVASVARAVGKHRMQVYRWLKTYALNHEDFRS